MFRDKRLLQLHQAFFPWWVARRPAMRLGGTLSSHCLTTSLSELQMHLPQINPAQTALQGTQVPSRIDRASQVSQELLITGICNWALLPSHCSWCTFSNFSTFLFLAAVNIGGFLRSNVWECVLKDPSLPAPQAALHAKMSDHLSVGKMSTLKSLLPHCKYPQPVPCSTWPG